MPSLSFDIESMLPRRPRYIRVDNVENELGPRSRSFLPRHVSSTGIELTGRITIVIKQCHQQEERCLASSVAPGCVRRTRPFAIREQRTLWYKTTFHPPTDSEQEPITVTVAGPIRVAWRLRRPRRRREWAVPWALLTFSVQGDGRKVAVILDAHFVGRWANSCAMQWATGK
ncbi:hypothetical protein BDW68DRAFT_179955 [Aspergillus falconensis]